MKIQSASKPEMPKRLWRWATLLLLVLIILSACGNAASTASSKGQTVNVNLSEFKIDAELATFKPGTSYHFVIMNNGQTVHEFMIMPKPEGSMSGMPMNTMDSMALASVDTINPGETRTLDYTFPSSTANSQPEFACYLPGHYEAGMKQEARVTA